MVNMHYPFSKGYLFAFYINNFWGGTLYKDGNLWLPLHVVPTNDKNRHNRVFELEAHDYQVLGELIEDHLGEYVV